MVLLENVLIQALQNLLATDKNSAMDQHCPYYDELCGVYDISLSNESSYEQRRNRIFLTWYHVCPCSIGFYLSIYILYIDL